ncbi:hypothetical protein C8E00_103467 [Chromohalobacter marismortui]|uniref:Uncharacterized protein n=2 Tax=Halomonadaceae TaxID=28256 RepID=A0A4R7NQ91_9GAMM|nr:hypothetical protein C8E00_103467 [Chromohalobacter marismortui]
MSDSEMYHMFKVMLFLPVMVGLAYLVYRKVVSKS